MKVATTFRRRLLMFACPIGAGLPASEVPSGLELRVLTDDQLGAYHALRGQPARVIEARLNRGCTCFVAYRDGVMVQAGWVATGRAREEYLGGDLLLAEHDIFHFDSYTHPGHRGRRLALLRNAFARRHYRELGFTRTTTAVAIENAAGLAAVEAMGYRAIGLYGCWRLGPWRRDWAQVFGEEFLPPLERP